MIRINLISGPRNISTALMYSFAQRKDTLVMDEPFYAVYLSKTGVTHPGREDVLRSQSTDENEVMESIFTTFSVPILFIKNMAHHIELLDERFVMNVTNVFLIRDPKQIITSYAKVVTTPVMRDLGIAYQYKLFEQLCRHGQHPVIVDSGMLLTNPGEVLKQWCDKLGISFTTDMLRWPPGPKAYDGVWAKYWYKNVHTSAGFEKQHTSNDPLPPALAALYEEARDYYEKLLPFSLNP